MEKTPEVLITVWFIQTAAHLPRKDATPAETKGMTLLSVLVPAACRQHTGKQKRRLCQSPCSRVSAKACTCSSRSITPGRLNRDPKSQSVQNWPPAGLAHLRWVVPIRPQGRGQTAASLLPSTVYPGLLLTKAMGEDASKSEVSEFSPYLELLCY